MSPLENLYSNMTEVCRLAAPEDLDVMLRVLESRLYAGHRAAAEHVSLAIIEFRKDLEAKRPRKDSSGCGDPACRRYHDQLGFHEMRG